LLHFILDFVLIFRENRYTRHITDRLVELKNHAEITNTDEVLGKVTGENNSCYVKKTQGIRDI
jgi:hypothetical protein